MTFDPWRAVEVFGPSAYGSGYRMAPALVVTAAHLLDGTGEASVTIRDRADRVLRAALAWRSDVQDIAVLELEEAEPSTPPIRVGRFGPTDGGVRTFDMAGWPRAAATRAPDGAHRSPVHVRGEVHLGERAHAGAGELRLRPSEQHPQLADGSWWEGMSGAAVFVDGLLVGVQARQPRAEITAYLAAEQLMPSVDNPGSAELDALLTRHEISIVEARGPQAAAVDRYLAELDRCLAAPPSWFPDRFHAVPGAVEALFQPPDFEQQVGDGWTSLGSLAEVADDAAVVILEGDAGAGKTWALAACTRALAAQVQTVESAPVLPAWCRLTDIDPTDGPAEILASAVAAVGPDADCLRGAPGGAESRASWHLHVDGVDEASDAQKVALGRLVDRALAGGSEIGRVVVATRPGELDIKTHPRLVTARLDPFASRKQAAFIRAWFADRSDESDTVRVLTEHWRVRESFSSPLVLALACVATEGAQAAHLSLHNSADIFRAATQSLIEGAHRTSGINARSVAGRRARRRTVETLLALAARLFGPDGYQPSLTERDIQDIDTQVLEACLDTGVVILRDDGGIDFANRSIATYLAAQEAALSGRWPERLSEVWDTTAAAEIVTFTPHALVAPLVTDARLATVTEWFDAVDARIAEGDPGFLLLHTLCAALTFLDVDEIPTQRARVVRTLRAHVLSNVDPRASDSLATLAPDVLADLFADVIDTSPGLDYALELANVGHARGFEALERILANFDPDDYEAHELGPTILEWLGRRGDSRGLALVARQAATGPAGWRLLAGLILAYWRTDGAEDLVSSALANETALTGDALVATWLLSQRGDETAKTRLVAARDSRDPAIALRALIWSPDNPDDLVERLTALAEGPLSAIAISAALALHEQAPGVCIRELERMAETQEAIPAYDDEDDDDGLAIGAAFWLGQVDADRGLARLAAQAVIGSRRSLGAAAAATGLNAACGAKLLLEIASNGRAEVTVRIGAAKVLEYLDRPETATAIEAILATGGEDAAGELNFYAPKESMISATSSFGAAVAAVQMLLAEPEVELERVITSHRGIADIRPSDGVWRDATDFMYSDFGPDSGAAPAIFPQFDLTSDAGRRALALAIPLFDVPGDRTYLMSQGAAIAPNDDWLRLMARWSVGDFTDSIRTEDAIVAARWEEPVAVLAEIGPGLLEWASIAWGDPMWIIGRCLPLVLDHANAGMLVEMSHQLERPVLSDMARGINGIRPMAGLSVTATRACIGQVCLDGLISALAEHEDLDAQTVREEARRRRDTLTCAHSD